MQLEQTFWILINVEILTLSITNISWKHLVVLFKYHWRINCCRDN